MMIAIGGTFQNGYVKLDEEYASERPIKVIVTFLDDSDAEFKQSLSLSDFSFFKSQNNLSDYQGSISDAVIDERRNDL